MCWLVDCCAHYYTYTFTCYSLKNWTHGGQRMTECCCRTYFTAAWSFIDYPKHPLSHVMFFHQLEASVSSRGWSGEDEICRLIGRAAGCVLRLAGQFSLMLHQVYNHFDITVSLQYVARLHLMSMKVQDGCLRTNSRMHTQRSSSFDLLHVCRRDFFFF